MDQLEIDGSRGEGGGQVLRSSISLSAITRTPVRISNIRESRSNPGLAAQQVTAVRAVAEVCSARTEGVHTGSQNVVFEPGEIKPGNYHWDIETAGSAPLVLQTVFPVLSEAGGQSNVTVEGGTHVQMSPTADYVIHLYMPVLRNLQYRGEIQIDRHGFFPRGGGKLKARILPRVEPESNRVDWTDQRKYGKVEVYSVATSDLRDRRVSERQVDGVRAIFGNRVVEGDVRYVDSYSTGTAVFVRPTGKEPVPGAIALGKKGKPSEDVGQEAANKLKPLYRKGMPLDRWMSDQVVLPLCQGGFEASLRVPELTSHLSTQLELMEEFSEHVAVNKEYLDGKKAIVHISSKG